MLPRQHLAERTRKYFTLFLPWCTYYVTRNLLNTLRVIKFKIEHYFDADGSSGIVRVLGKKYIKRLLTVNTMYYMKPQKPNLKVMDP